MELLYNPDRMPEEEIKATFVAREQLVDELVALVEGQPDGAGVQHAVIIAPRGMGKTTVLLMVKFAIKDRGLGDRWQAVKFPEESYGVYDLADFWVETLNLIAADTTDTELRQLADNLKTKYPNNDELQEAAYAALKDWRRKHGRRLLLLVENFDQILEQINDERDNARLRDALMNDGTVMFLGGATTFFKEARAYDQPLYNFFKIYDLADLKFAQMQELLRRRAELDRIADFESRLKENAARLRTLEYFTGGNPRLVLMLYRVVSRSDVTEVRRALEKLLDEVTPYYKAKVETLPPQQRKILDHIARVSGETNEGLTPGEIAAAVRLSPNQVSSQLKRLSELGYVRATNLRGRSSCYTLSEPLYAIWHQMRFGRNARERMEWLVSFLRLWYGVEEMGAESRRLERQFRRHIRANHSQEAHDVLEHHRYLMEAMADGSTRLQATERVIRGHLELKDIATVNTDLLSHVNPADLSDQTLGKLFEVGCLDKDQITNAKASREKSAVASQDKKFAEVMAAAMLANEEGKYDDALRYLDRALALKPDRHEAWIHRGLALYHLGRYEESVSSYDRALEKEPSSYDAWHHRGHALLNNPNKQEEALANFKFARGIDPSRSEIHLDCGSTLYDMEEYEEALDCFDRALEISPSWQLAWLNRGKVLSVLGRGEDAIASYDRALDIEPDHYETWMNRGAMIYDLGRYAEAITSYDRALQVKPDSYEAWINRGGALYHLKRYEEAVASCDRALEIKRDFSEAWVNRGNTLALLNRYEEAITSYDYALKIDPQDYSILNARGHMFGHLGKYEEEITNYDRALEIKPDCQEAWYNRGVAYLKMFADMAHHEKLDSAKQKWDEALASGSKSKLESWPDAVSEALLEVAQAGRLEFASQLIAEEGLEERLFPLARAIDYLQTGDEALIEKLSPEVRGIVEEVVAKLKATSQTGS